MLARRQRLVDFNCLAQAAIEGDFAKAARYLRPGAPATCCARRACWAARCGGGWRHAICQSARKRDPG
jgi:hypothetical protein